MITYRKDDLTIRPMEKDDVDKILTNFTGQGWKKPRAVIEQYLSRQSAGELYMFIAGYNGDVTGYAVLYPEARSGPFAAGHIPEIGDFNVFMKYQRRGIGNKILDAAEKQAGTWGGRVSLAVGLHSGYGAAQRIYVKRGYIPDGSGAWYQNHPLEQYAECQNDDDLVLYLSKNLDQNYR